MNRLTKREATGFLEDRGFSVVPAKYLTLNLLSPTGSVVANGSWQTIMYVVLGMMLAEKWGTSPTN